jgi:benzoyl-CoA 2,3-dioxygenase component B
MRTRISNWDDWVDYFDQWLGDIGYDREMIKQFELEVKFAELPTSAIEFGGYKGRNKWETALQIPDQRIRDALLHLIVYQSDTEFASVEQQRNLVDTAPSDYDLYSLLRVNAEEMRHGWQMCYLMVKYFGETGRVEAQKQLERRAFEGNRLLGSFNQPIHDWLDFFTFTNFVDRDGKFQLKMLSTSAFAPLAASVRAMLKEEQFHMGTGNNGLRRILKAGKIPTPIIQRYLNKWISTAYDLFGKDHSTSAEWAYEWGLKGRYDEEECTDEPARDSLNERSRLQYRDEVDGLIQALNKAIPEGQPKLFTPDPRFHRSIGDFASETWSATGDKLTPEAYEKHVGEALPTEEDGAILADIFKSKDWIEPKKSRTEEMSTA